MLKILRKKGVAKKILIGLAIIIVPAFVLWGSASLIRERQQAKFAGRIFGKNVSMNQYSDALTATRNFAIIRYGDDFNKVQRFLNLNAETWDRLILLYEANRKNIRVSDAEVAKKISEFAFFKKDSKFNNEVYGQLLKYVFSAQPREFEEQIRQFIMLEKLSNQITKDVAVSDEEVLSEYKQENEKVKIEFIQITPDSFVALASVNDDEVKKYYDEHKDQLRKPQSVNIDYIGEEFAADATDADKQAIKEKLTQIKEKINKPDDFKKISAEENLLIKETGFFSRQGPVPAIGWAYQFIETAFELTVNQISDPILTPKGCFILSLKEKKESYIPSLDESKEQVTSILKQEKAKTLSKEKADEYYQRVLEIYRANPKALDFQKLAKEWNTKSEKTELFSRRDYVPSVGKSDDFTKAAFALNDKDAPIDIVSTLAATFIIRLVDYQPVDMTKFEEVRADFAKRVLENKKNQSFNDFFEQLKNKANLVDNIGILTQKTNTR